MRAPFLALLPLLVLLAPPLAAASPDESHKGVLRTQHFEVRYRPGSRAGAHAEAVARGLEHDLERIATAITIKPKGRWKAFLYDDTRELSVITGTTGSAGFSTGDTLHLPYGVPQTRFHELVHVVAATWPATGKEKRGFFVIEGLANALLEFVDGVHVHAVAADLLRRNELAALAEMRGDFYAWCRAHPKARSYDVAASFMRCLLDEYGPERVRRYYTGTPARAAFGADQERLEAAWRDMLRAYKIRPEVALLLRELGGEEVKWASYDGLPADVVGKPGDWIDLTEASLHPDGAAEWKRREEGLHVHNKEAVWATCEVGKKTYGDCAVRVRILTPRPVPVQVRLGPENQVMLVNGLFLYRGEKAVASSQRARMDAERRETDLLVVRRGKRIRVWVDGRLALDAPATEQRARPGVGVHTGEATFVEFRVRALSPR